MALLRQRFQKSYLKVSIIAHFSSCFHIAFNYVNLNHKRGLIPKPFGDKALVKSFADILTSLLTKRLSLVLPKPLNPKQALEATFPHIHTSWEIIVLDNDVIYVTPPGVAHDSLGEKMRCSIEIDLRKISFRLYKEGSFHTWQIPDKLTHFHLAPELLTMLNRLYPTQPISEHLFSSTLASLLLVAQKLSSLPEVISPQITAEQVISYLQHHYYQMELSLDTMSDIFGISPQYLNRILRNNGFSPLCTALAEIRLAKAKELLDNGNYRIRDVARMTGWRSPSYFSSRFRLKYKLSPKHFQTRVGKKKSQKHRVFQQSTTIK